MKRIAINTDKDKVATTIKAGYYKFGWTNFTRAIFGKVDGFKATAILEIQEQ